MQSIKQQQNELVPQSTTQRAPREAVAEDFSIGSVLQTDAERKAAITESDRICGRA
jgi:hypothetical protein